VLSRGFVRRALEIPLGGLEEEVRWLYYTKGRLGRVLAESRRLVEKSKALNAENTPYTESEQELSVPRLTGGGIITLERSLVKLQGLWDTYQSSVKSG
jgi:ubiquitin-conjugating enzyme E2 O